MSLVHTHLGSAWTEQSPCLRIRSPALAFAEMIINHITCTQNESFGEFCLLIDAIGQILSSRGLLSACVAAAVSATHADARPAPHSDVHTGPAQCSPDHSHVRVPALALAHGALSPARVCVRLYCASEPRVLALKEG